MNCSHYIKLPILLLSLSSLLYAESKNEDNTMYKSPRLAGDSLAIKPLDKSSNLGASSIMDMFVEGKVKGLIRYGAQHRNTSYHSTQSGISPIQEKKTQQYSAIGGYLGYETASLYNLSLGATFYTAEPVGNNPDEWLGLGGLNEEGGSANNYAVLGEAYIKLDVAGNDIRYGRREMPSYRFISLSNIRFSPFTHQGTTYENTMLEDMKFIAGYIDKQKDRNAEDFQDMVRSARVNKSKAVSHIDENNFDASGNYKGEDKSMAMLGYSLSKGSVNLEVWDYYVVDFVNTFYMYSDYTYNINALHSLSFAMQYANQRHIGSQVAGDIDSWFYGLKMQYASKEGITAFANFNEVAYNEESYDGGTLFVRWGTPQMFNSFQVQDSELAGTKSIGLGLQLELGRMNIVPNTVIRFRYGLYDMPDNLQDKFAAQDRSESTFDLRYSFTKNDGFGIFTEMKGLSVQFRLAYNDYKTDYNYDAYKAEHGVTFEDVTNDFVDTRLYVDYLF